MSKVTDILDRKGRQVHTTEYNSSVFDAVKKMVDKNVGSLLVMKSDALCGIITERDYLRRIVLEDRTSKTTEVADVMTERLVCVDSSMSIEECMAMMSQQRIRHLPVIDDGKLSGVLSIGDLVKHLSREREIEIRYLTDYISGKYPG